jgi:hypothetical protein
MLPPPSVGGIELTSGSLSVGASPTVATAISPANGSSGQLTSPLVPTGRWAVGTPPRSCRTGVKTETLPYRSGSLVARPSGVRGIVSAALMPLSGENWTASAPLPCRLEMTP